MCTTEADMSHAACLGDESDSVKDDSSAEKQKRRKNKSRHTYEEGFESAETEDDSGNETDKVFLDNSENPSEHNEICQAKT
jgi:hypothetical protein